MVRLTIVCGVLALFCACSESPPPASGKPEAGPPSAAETQALPLASLDPLYPPQTEIPVLNAKMLEMASSLAGVVVDMHERDFEQADYRFREFRERYAELARLVPEWEPDYAMEPVEALGKAVADRDVDGMHAALGSIDPVCVGAHVARTGAVQQRYYWKDWAGITVSDAVTASEMAFKPFKQQMWTSFAGIRVSLEEGQMPRVIENFQAFQARFLAFEAACVDCHDSERRYYVNEELKTAVSALGAALASDSPDPATVEELSREIGSESCQKCHLVHSPAALARVAWTRSRL